MKFLLALSGIAALCGAVFVADRGSVAAQDEFPWNMASESYYRLDVPNGTASVRVEAVLQNPHQDELPLFLLWAMPKAANVVVKQCEITDPSKCETPLESKTEAAGSTAGVPTLVTVTLGKALAPKAKMNLVMTYDVPAQSSEFVKFEPGVIEALFVSQGAGSFVYIDVPLTGENVFEPGCLKAADQPDGVREAGFQRWICGDAALIAFASEDEKTQQECANADDRCRQRVLELPFSAFAQSITDPSKQGVLEAVVQLGRGPVKLQLRYFRRDEAWANSVFPIAVEVLPKLEALFGFLYPRDTILMRESNFIGLGGAAGVAFPDQGELLLAFDPDNAEFNREVIIHELAHQWAGRNLEGPWLWEGLAEYSTQTIAATVGVKVEDMKWQSYGYKDPIAMWHNGSTIRNSNYWYGKSGAFWFEYAKAIGGAEKMTTVLALLDDDPAKLPVDGRWFMDRGEEVSGANLDELFLTWVFNRETVAPLLAERRAARDAVVGLYTAAGAQGLEGVPSDILANLGIWEFGPVHAQVEKATKLIADYQAVAAMAEAAGLPPSAAVAKSWGSNPTATTAGVIADTRLAIEAIASARKSLGENPSAVALKRIEDAKAKYAAGDLGGARQIASSSTTDGYNADSATKLIAQAKETESKFKASLFSRVGLLLSDPKGDLVAADTAFAEGDYARAIDLARSAQGAWEGAESAGILRLGGLLGVLCVLTVGGWLLVGRGRPGSSGRSRTAGTLPDAPAVERKSSWRDWENTP